MTDKNKENTENTPQTDEITKKPSKKITIDQKRKIAGAGALLAVLIIVIGAAVLKRGNDAGEKTAVKNGEITDGSTSSYTIENLFYEVGKDQYLINIGDLDEAISADVIKTDNGYAIRTQKKQVTVLTDEDAYYVDANKITEDDGYIKPVNFRGGIYADTRTIFDVFGYSVSYKTNADDTFVSMTITRTGDDPYTVITPHKEEIETLPETKPQVEESAIHKEVDINKPVDDASLQTVPQPTERMYGEDETETYAETSAAETESPVEETTVTETMAQVERTKEMPNRKSDEEFNETWKEDKKYLTDLFKGGTAEYGNIPYREVADNYIAFNPMTKATYYDTISVIEEPGLGNNEFIVATFAEDWDDLEGLTPFEASKAFYRGIPAMYERTIKKLLGENTGTEFFNWLKAHADKKTKGGYIGKFDEKMNLYTEWTDDEVGDGIQASKISFEEWISRTTDDGLRFDVTQQGNGFKITIYKN